MGVKGFAIPIKAVIRAGEDGRKVGDKVVKEAVLFRIILPPNVVDVLRERKEGDSEMRGVHNGERRDKPRESRRRSRGGRNRDGSGGFWD